jgi:hypothetical protein
LQLQRGIRGEVITLRIVSFSSWDYLFTCDKLQELQAELVGTFDGEDIFLKESTCRLQTHRFGVFAITSLGIRTIGVWDISLEVPNRSKKSAARAVAALAFHAMRIKASSQASWDAQFLAINWMQLLQEKAQNELGQYHNLNGEAIIDRKVGDVG